MKIRWPWSKPTPHVIATTEDDYLDAQNFLCAFTFEKHLSVANRKAMMDKLTLMVALERYYKQKEGL